MCDAQIRVLIIGSNILGNSTATRRFREVIGAVEGVEATYVGIDQEEIEKCQLPRNVRRYQLIPTYGILRKKLRKLADLEERFDIIFVITCQPLLAIRGLWPKARIALWFDGLPHHPGEGVFSLLMNAASRILYNSQFSRVQYLLPMSGWAERQIQRFKFSGVRLTIRSPIRVSREIWGNVAPIQPKAGEVVRVLLVGNNAEGKGFVDFFSWCYENRKDLSAFNFTIVSNDRSSALREVVRGMPVTIVGDITHADIERLAEIYHSSHIFLLPTKADMMPNVLIEASASQLPCIATNIGAINEVVIDGRTGWLVEHHRWDLFFDRLKTFSENPGQFSRDELRGNAERFFAEQMINDVKKIIYSK